MKDEEDTKKIKNGGSYPKVKRLKTSMCLCSSNNINILWFRNPFSYNKQVKSLMRETQEDYYLILFMFASQLYFYILGPISLLDY